MSFLKRVLVTGSLLFAFVYSGWVSAAAFTPSPAQIEQFKKLPPETQRQLAKQYGFDLDAIKGGGSVSKAEPLVEKTNTIQPRTADLSKPTSIQESDIEANEQGLKPFGYDLFAGEPSSFEPANDIPVPVDYVVGPGDTINVQLFGKVNEKYELLVSRDGLIDFPGLGPIAVAGAHFEEMKRTLQSRISKQIIGVESSISMGELRSMRVFVLGDAWRPGSYTVSSLATVTQALYVSGGIKQIGSLRNIQVKRNGKLITTFDLYDLLMDGDSSKDIRLQPGDVVFVPSLEKTVTIDGQVRRPGIYEVKSGETSASVIRMAGGLLPDAYVEAITIDRVDNRRIHSLHTIDFANESGKRFTIENGDALKVGSVSDNRENAVTLEGAVYRPGNYGWTSGMRLSDIVRNIDSDLWKEADLDYAIIVRERNVKREIDVIQTSIVDAIADKLSAANVPLHAKDKVIVFSKWDSNDLEINASLITKTTGIKLDEQQTDNNSEFNSELEIEKRLVKINNNARKRYEQHLQSRETQQFERDIRLAGASRAALLKPVLEQVRNQNQKGEPLAIVTISGQVRYPGEYALSQSTKVADLLKAAGGVTEAAYLLEAELTRTDLSNPTLAKIDHSVIDIRAALAGDSNANVALQSRDSLMIRQLPDWQKELKVELRGEFVLPGQYTFRRGETLSQVIQRAGGLTKFAFPKGAVFMREELREAELLRLKQVQEKLKAELAASQIASSQSGKVVSQDATQAAALLEQVNQVQATGRLVINLENILNLASEYDVQLQPGDKLFVPTEKQSLTVVGEVQYPTSHLFDDDESTSTYIERSGGLTLRADDDRIYIIKADGSVQLPKSSFWFSSTTTNLEAGDTIVVPLDTAYMRPLELWTAVTQIMYNSAVAIAAIGSL